MSMFGDDTYRHVCDAALDRLGAALTAEQDARNRAEALASRLANALERERDRYHALAQSLVPTPAPSPDEYEAMQKAAINRLRLTDTAVPLAVTHAINRVASGDERLRAHLWGWVGLPEQRDRMQTPTGLAGVVDEIVRGKQRSA